MNKKELITFIQKYYLNGSCKSVRWDSDGNKLTVAFLTDDSSMMGMVVSDLDVDPGVFAVNSTDRLLSLLGALSDELVVKFDVRNDNIVGMELADDYLTVYYAGGELLRVFDNDRGTLKNFRDSGHSLRVIPVNTCEFEIGSDLIKRFIKSKKALSDTKHVALDRSELILNYSKLNENKIVIPIETVGNPTSVFVYNIEHVTNILSSNDDVESGIVKVSNAGLLTFEFATARSKSVYYLNPLKF